MSLFIVLFSAILVWWTIIFMIDAFWLMNSRDNIKQARINLGIALTLLIGCALLNYYLVL